MNAYDSTVGKEAGLHGRRHHAARQVLAMAAMAWMGAACELDVVPRMRGVSAAPGPDDAGPERSTGTFKPSRVRPVEAGTVDHRDAAVQSRPDAAVTVDTDEPDAAVPGPPVCVEDELRVTPCGLNGRGQQDLICTAGEFREDGPCSDPDVCADDATRDVPCGLNGNGSQAQLCASGQWQQHDGACEDADACINDEMRNVPCGLNGNGTQAQRCSAGEWQENGACSDPDVCVDDETRTSTCGPNGNGTRPQRCGGGQWQNEGACVDQDVCTNAATGTLPCGVLGGGTLPQLCMSGQWQDDGACNDPDWTCSVAAYDAGDGCDCDCGSRDPDCDLDWRAVVNCAADEFCNTQGACEDVPDDWECDASFYDARDGCDCECGVHDPDCAVEGQTVYGCSDDETCDADGTCEESD